MEQTQKIRWHIYFSGKVQHVGFRYVSTYLARELHITGWVNNLPDGRVEMEAQGEVSALRRLLLRLRGQSQIRITGLELREIPPVAHERRFEPKGVGY